MLGLDAIVMTGFLLAANPVQCTVPQAPLVRVIPQTSEIKYDTTKTIAELSAYKSDTISPYDRHTEQIMFGLHRGRLQLSSSTTVGYGLYPRLGLACLYYDSVKIELKLEPKIYLVSELKKNRCAYNAVLEHEKKHVAVDREIANKYAYEIGRAVQEAVNRAGALGPYPEDDIEEVQKRMTDHIGSAIASVELLMAEEQSRRQQDVDSLEEYERVGTLVQDTCNFRVEKDAKESLNALKGKRKDKD